MVVDLPLVPVMATNGERGARLRRSRQNSSMSPITSTPACCASVTLQCGSGCVSGTPGASSSAETFDQSSERRSAVVMPAAAALASDAALSSNAIDVRAAGLERLRAGQSRAAEPEQGDGLPGKAGGGDHRSLSVASPASASTIEMIQNRITICDSVQPCCSK